MTTLFTFSRSQAPALPALRNAKGLLTVAALATAGFLIAGQAAAQGPGHAFGQGHGQGHGHKMDANKDGNITRAEAANHPRLLQHFDAIDTNKDGTLSAAERQEFAKSHKGSHQGEGMKRLDGNADGNISKDEASKHPRLAKHFDQIDSNKDGVLSPAELQAFRAAHGGKK